MLLQHASSFILTQNPWLRLPLEGVRLNGHSPRSCTHLWSCSRFSRFETTAYYTYTLSCVGSIAGQHTTGARIWEHMSTCYTVQWEHMSTRLHCVRFATWLCSSNIHIYLALRFIHQYTDKYTGEKWHTTRAMVTTTCTGLHIGAWLSVRNFGLGSTCTINPGQYCSNGWNKCKCRHLIRCSTHACYASMVQRLI